MPTSSSLEPFLIHSCHLRGRIFTGSLESSIYLLSSICSVPLTISVLPAINTNFTHHISVSLADGSTITGQNNISHPNTPTALTSTTPFQINPPSPNRLKHDTEESDNVEDANLPGSLPSLRKPAIQFSKTDEEDLPSRIERLWYINPYGQEIRLPANSRVIDAINSSSSVIYSIGSLFTSIIPCLILRGVGNAIANPAIRSKILILNGSIDRETGPSTTPFTALDFVAAIANACAESRGLQRPEASEYRHYVTHVIYLDCAGAPEVDRTALKEVDIEGMRLYGKEKGRYDDKALQQCLEMVLGRRDPRQANTRRNTLER